jgi:antirestriction protein ArdC
VGKKWKWSGGPAEDAAGDEFETCLFARATPVFAAEQVDGYTLPAPDTLAATVIEPIDAAEAFINATGATIEHGGSRAF